MLNNEYTMIRENIKIIQDFLDLQRKLPDIEMEVTDDQLFPNKESI